VLRGDGDEIAVIVRQYYSDRTKEVPLTLNIARVDANAPKQMRTWLDKTFFAEGARRAFANLEVAATTLCGCGPWLSSAEVWCGQATMGNTIRAHMGISAIAHNAFVCGNGTNLFPTLDNRYMVAYFDGLAADEHDEQASPVILIRGCAARVGMRRRHCMAKRPWPCLRACAYVRVHQSLSLRLSIALSVCAWGRWRHAGRSRPHGTFRCVCTTAGSSPSTGCTALSSTTTRALPCTQCSVMSVCVCVY
jgi:hypothetical protein